MQIDQDCDTLYIKIFQIFAKFLKLLSKVSWFLFKNFLIENLKLSMFISRPKPLLFKGDHRFPSSNSESPVVIFYSEIGHEEFYNIHHQLISKSNEGKINYVFRHYISVSIDLFYKFFEY